MSCQKVVRWEGREEGPGRVRRGAGYVLHRLRVAIFLKALLSVFFCFLLLFLFLALPVARYPLPAACSSAVANVLLLTFWRIKLAALDNNLYLICDKSMQNSDSLACQMRLNSIKAQIKQIRIPIRIRMMQLR